MNQPRGHVLLMRHAHAEWPGYNGEDFHRPLTPRGLEDAAAAARAIREAGHLPCLLLASTARRTQQTAEIVARELELSPQALRLADELYNAGTVALARALANALSSVQAGATPRGPVLLIAHNPGISGLARQLSGDSVRPPFSPAGWACFST